MTKAIFATFSGGSANAPKRSISQLRGQAYLRSFICSSLALDDVHLYLFLAPKPTYKLLSEHLGAFPRLHLLPMTGGSGGPRLQHARYTEYLALIRGPAANVTKLVLADASDVIFQADPFPLITHGLYTAEESASYTLGSHRANAMWVSELFGEATLSALADGHVLCSGLTMGTVSAISAYLELMAAETSQRLTPPRLNELRQRHGRDICRGLDQGIHNVLVRSKLSRLATVLPSGRSVIFHGNEMRCGVDVALNGSRLAYVHGEVPLAIAHQFGRIKGACQRVVRRVLTCRAVDAGGESRRVPSFCRSCAARWPTWLGDDADSWRSSPDRRR